MDKKIENYCLKMKKVEFVTHIANRICKASCGEIGKLFHSQLHVFTDLDHKLPIFSKIEFAVQVLCKAMDLDHPIIVEVLPNVCVNTSGSAKLFHEQKCQNITVSPVKGVPAFPKS